MMMIETTTIHVKLRSLCLPEDWTLCNELLKLKFLKWTNTENSVTESQA